MAWLNIAMIAILPKLILIQLIAIKIQVGIFADFTRWSSNSFGNIRDPGEPKQFWKRTDMRAFTFWFKKYSRVIATKKMGTGQRFYNNSTDKE